jgi:signal transduction histidine kinase
MAPRTIKSLGALPSSHFRSRRREHAPDARLRSRGGERLAAERAARLEAEAERDRLARALAEVSRDRQDFLAAAAHDLRTPLAALMLHVQALIAHPERAAGERLATRLKAMDRQIRHMTELVNRLLELAQIEGGELRLAPERVDLVELARDVAQRFEPELAWARCPFTLHAGAPLVGSWDRLHLEQVLGNLIANAIKYGAGAPVEVRVSEHGPRARIEVRDHGIGIAPEEQETIFERFRRAPESRPYKGLGLGLWIVKQIVEASGGTIAVESRPGAGATFVVDLPRGLPST